MESRMVKRLNKDLQAIQKNYADQFAVVLPTNDIRLWHVTFEGAEGTIYAKEKLKLQFNLVTSPSKPPRCCSSTARPTTSTSTPTASSASPSSTTSGVPHSPSPPSASPSSPCSPPPRPSPSPKTTASLSRGLPAGGPRISGGHSMIKNADSLFTFRPMGCPAC